ncbi:hypothetical protein OIV83_005745, partial [Microbotryomycetes sp. JL201]
MSDHIDPGFVLQVIYGDWFHYNRTSIFVSRIHKRKATSAVNGVAILKPAASVTSLKEIVTLDMERKVKIKSLCAHLAGVRPSGLYPNLLYWAYRQVAHDSFMSNLCLSVTATGQQDYWRGWSLTDEEEDLPLDYLSWEQWSQIATWRSRNHEAVFEAQIALDPTASCTTSLFPALDFLPPRFHQSLERYSSDLLRPGSRRDEAFAPRFDKRAVDSLELMVIEILTPFFELLTTQGLACDLGAWPLTILPLDLMLAEHRGNVQLARAA